VFRPPSVHPAAACYFSAPVWHPSSAGGTEERTPHTKAHRYEHAQEPRGRGFRIATALRGAFRAGYGARDFRADAMAGLVVGVVALPLSMALAIASGVPPQYGLYTAIVAGGVIAALGGSAVNVSGPTAAFVVLLAPIAGAHGLAGLVLATLLAGVLLVVMGLCGFGRLIQFIPHPVTTGFTAGIAVVIATLQLKDFFGLTVPHPGEHYAERVVALVHAAPSVSWEDLLVGSFTLAILFVFPRIT